MTTSTTVFVPGTVYWAKIVGHSALVDNYERTGKEWTYELVPDDTSFLKTHKLLDRLKDKDDPRNPNKGEYLHLKKPELTRDGDCNEPIKILDKDGSPWDDRLIGNGTRVVAKLTIKDWGVGKKKSIYTAAIRIEDLVSYERDEFGAYDGATSAGTGGLVAEETPVRKNTKSKVQEGVLDDEIPF